jgi:hypothetical protein
VEGLLSHNPGRYELKDWIRNFCLKCGKRFNAQSKTNRICYECQLKNDELKWRVYSVSFVEDFIERD